MVGNHRLQRLVCPLLEGGQSLLHQKTLRRQTKDVCLRLLHLALQSFNLGSLVSRESYSNIQTENLLCSPPPERATTITRWRQWHGGRPEERLPRAPTDPDRRSPSAGCTRAPF